MKVLRSCAIVLATIIVISSGFYGSVFAETYKPCVISLDGKEVSFISPILNVDDTVMVPLSEAAEMFNATVTEEVPGHSVKCIKEHMSIDMTIDQDFALVNGTKTEMPQAFHLIDDTYYVSIRFLAEALGNTVTWKNRTVEITSGSVVFVGDSLTHFFDFQTNFPETNIINKGVSGNLTFDVIPRVGALKELKPKKIFLMIGTNDMWCAINKNVMLNNYRTILNTFLNDEPWATIYLESILPEGQAALDRNSKSSNAAIDDMNNELKKLADELNIQYVDIASEYKDAQGRMDSQYTTDGIHLKKEAYCKWTDKVKALVDGN